MGSFIYEIGTLTIPSKRLIHQMTITRYLSLGALIWIANPSCTSHTFIVACFAITAFLVKRCFQKYIFVLADERLVHLPYRIIS